MPRLISRAELARLAKVSGAAVTKACRKQLADAVRGDRIDVDAPSVVAYLKTKGAKPPTDLARTPQAKPKPRAARAPTKPAKAPPPAPTKPTAPRPPEPQGADDLAKYADMTLRQLVAQFGTDRAFKDWLDARIKIETAREKRLANDEADGRLISREGVRGHMLAVVDACFRRLLQDAPRTLAAKLLSRSKASPTLEEFEQLIRSEISSQLTAMKESVVRSLRDPE
jgi:pyruvate/2-oxoglutarate dehydrogenase complex dihydrolipoamide acyltransferase (E2) component